jgi:hypothetical protein
MGRALAWVGRSLYNITTEWRSDYLVHNIPRSPHVDPNLERQSMHAQEPIIV